jgi:beta-lactamase regulating signal transducer with metallopeptidase domain
MHTINQLLITYVANSIWMTSLIAMVAMLISRLFSQSRSSHRHALWSAALIGCSLLPIATLWNGGATETNVGDNNAATISATAIQPEMNQTASTRPFWLRLRRPLRPILFAPLATGFLSIAYLGLMGYRTFCIYWAWRRTRRILDGAMPCLLSQGNPALRNCDSLLKQAGVSLFSSRAVRAPSVLGWRRTALIVPAWFAADCSQEEIAAAVCHELAHVKRHDFLINFIHELLFVPLSFHPVAWFIKKRIEHTRELACDETAAEQGSSPLVYARSLLRIAQRIASNAVAAESSHALGLFDSNSLEGRIMHLVGNNHQTVERRPYLRLAIATSLFLMTCVATSVVSIQVALAAPPEDAARFAGTWEGKFKGKTFITVSLTSKGEKISGHVSRTNIEMDANGNLTEASVQDGEDEIAETAPQGNVLHLSTKAKGKVDTGSEESDESIQYEMTLSGETEAQLQIAGVPPGMPAPKPWRLEKAPKSK